MARPAAKLGFGGWRGTTGPGASQAAAGTLMFGYRGVERPSFMATTRGGSIESAAVVSKQEGLGKKETTYVWSGQHLLSDVSRLHQELQLNEAWHQHVCINTAN